MSTTDGRMICPDCGSSSYLVVDGKEMSLHDLLHLEHAPRKIERRLPHAVWCVSDQNRGSILQAVTRAALNREHHA